MSPSEKQDLLETIDASERIDKLLRELATQIEPLTFAGVGTAIIDAMSALRIPPQLLLLSGAWVFVFSLAVTRITRQWRFAAISKVHRGESVAVSSLTGTKTLFRFRHDADLVWVSSRRLRWKGTWYRRVETPTGKGLIPDEHVNYMLDAYLGAE